MNPRRLSLFVLAASLLVGACGHSSGQTFDVNQAVQALAKSQGLPGATPTYFSIVPTCNNKYNWSSSKTQADPAKVPSGYETCLVQGALTTASPVSTMTKLCEPQHISAAANDPSITILVGGYELAGTQLCNALEQSGIIHESTAPTVGGA